jgi:hypothetical protein
VAERPNNPKKPALRRGIVVISIDTEQIWGYFDLTDESGFSRRFPHSVAIHDPLLDALCSAGISATWAVVGAFSLPGTSGQLDSRFAGLRKEWVARIAAGDEVSSPLWYRRSFVIRLRDAQPKQDVGIHGGLTHLIWNDSKTSQETASKELDGGIRALEEIGIKPTSLVFPRDIIAHLQVLSYHGIRSYRGRAPILSEKLGFSLAARVARGVEEVGRFIPPLVWPKEVLPGLWDIPASTSLYSMRPAASRVAPLSTRLQRIRLGIEAAIRRHGIFHLCFHPENLAEAPWSFAVFESIVEEMARRRDAGDIEILTMNQVVDRMSNSLMFSDDRFRNDWNEKSPTPQSGATMR